MTPWHSTSQHVLQEAPAEDRDRWTAAGGGAAPDSCCVIAEDAPLPGAALGHMSFGAFNPAVEALQVRWMP